MANNICGELLVFPAMTLVQSVPNTGRIFCGGSFSPRALGPTREPSTSFVRGSRR
jgi:hypothetical protein